jgi:hypothetical protein
MRHVIAVGIDVAMKQVGKNFGRYGINARSVGNMVAANRHGAHRSGKLS